MLRLSRGVTGAMLFACTACGADAATVADAPTAASAGAAGSDAVGPDAGGSAGVSGAVGGVAAGRSSAGDDSGGSSGEASGGSSVAGSGGNGGTAPTRPNVVVVLLDDMGYSDLSPYGGEIRTPNIAQLAETGMRFRNFYVTPRCSPTRMSLMTGLYTQQVATKPGEPLPPMRWQDNVTLPEMLGAAGYRTYMAGKWHLGELPEQFPSKRGFQHVFGIGVNASGAGANKWTADAYSFVSQDNAIPARQYPSTPGAFYQTNVIGDYALDYLEHNAAQHDDAPFFMYLAFNAPHFPLQAPRTLVEDAPQGGGKSYLEMYGSGWTDWRNRRFERMLQAGAIDASYMLSPPEEFGAGASIPLWSSLMAPRKADLTRKMALHAAMIESVDAAVGRVVARLKDLGQFENTLIFVLSDNGGNAESGVFGQAFGAATPVTGEKLQNLGMPEQPEDKAFVGGGWANVQNTPFRFFKHYTHGGGVRSPLVVSWPANTKQAGGWTNQVGHVIDLAPTILAAAHVTQPTTFDDHAVLPIEGTSLVGTIANGSEPTPRQIGFEHETNRAWIDGKFKLVVRHENNDRVELYNLEQDPTELHDIAAAQPQRVAEMTAAWNAWATHVGVPADRQLPEK
jgi:arylsulfatase A-like enzyme